MSFNSLVVARGSAANDLKAGVLMLVAVVCYSSLSLAVGLTGGSDNPFLFTMWWRLGMVGGIGLYLALRYPGLFFDTRVWGRVRLKAGSVHLWLTLLAYFDISLFVMSTVFISITAATILVQVTSIFFILFMHRLDRDRVYRSITWTTGFLMLLGIVGFAFVVIAETGGADIAFETSAWRLATGVLIVLSCALVGAFNAHSFQWGRQLASEHRASFLEEGDGQIYDEQDLNRLVFFYVVLGSWVVNILAVLANGAVGFGTSLLGVYGGVSGSTLVYAVAWGAVAFTAAVILNRKANLMTTNLGVNALNYARPVFGVALLVFFAGLGADVARVDIRKPDYFLIGVLGIVSVNILINFEGERLLGFKALVISLWVFGALVYLRKVDGDLLTLMLPEVGYFYPLVLLSTVVVLILLFRVVRLAGRMRDEANRTCRLFRELAALSRRDVIGFEVCRLVPVIDRSGGEDLRGYYGKARALLLEATDRAGSADVGCLTLLEAELDSLVCSRRQDINFGGLCALFIFVGITVGLALVSRPAVAGLIAFVIELFTLLFASVIVFLAFNVLDIRQDRRALILHDDAGGQYSVFFRDQGSRMVEQWVSVMVGLAVVVAYFGLLGAKWLAWFGGPWV